MNFLHYLYIKGLINGRKARDARFLIVLPVYLLSCGFMRVSGFPSSIADMGVFYIYLFLICWIGILYGITFIILPPKTVKKSLRTWLKKYQGVTNGWAYLYIASPVIIGILCIVFGRIFN